MADTPVTNSYIATIELATAYFVGDPRSTAFVALASGMAWYLQRATKNIDTLKLKGRKYMMDGTQALQFPRIYMTDQGWYPDTNELGTVEVPQAVEDACCEEALAIYLFHADTDRSERKTMAEDGVKSYRLGGDYSENLGIAASDKHGGLMSSEAYDLMSQYILRAFQIV